MQIPLVGYWDRLPDRKLVLGAYAGKECFYKTGLLNVLYHLKPINCLEIGTHYGGTSLVFNRYFECEQSNGNLLTTDLKLYLKLAMPRIHQVVVYPHSLDVINRHWVTPADLLTGYESRVGDSVNANCTILGECMKTLDIAEFDFAFIDGDHTRDSALKDIAIARKLTKPPHHLLLDDTKEAVHEVSVLYKNELSAQYSHYDFEDWPVFIGMSLIWDNR